MLAALGIPSATVKAFFGILVFLLIAFAMSSNRKTIKPRIVLVGLLVQFIISVICLNQGVGTQFLLGCRNVVDTFSGFSDEGAKFVFGQNFADHFFAFKVMPTIIFMSTISYLLFYFGIMQKIVWFFALIMQKTMGLSGTESAVTAANIFLGQTEAPLFVKPYIDKMTRSELSVMMTGGFATVAGGVLIAYAGMGIDAGHLVVASLMSAPAAVVISKIMYPETATSGITQQIDFNIKAPDKSFFEAAVNGASQGLTMVMNILAMIIAFVALIALANYLLANTCATIMGLFGYQPTEPITLELIMSYIFAPLAYLMSVDSQEILGVGRLLAEKLTVTEFIAYLNLEKLYEAGSLSQRSKTIATYALCGFANFLSIAIQVGGIGSIAPSKKAEMAKIGLKTMIGGNLAAFMTACFASFWI